MSLLMGEDMKKGDLNDAVKVKYYEMAMRKIQHYRNLKIKHTQLGQQVAKKLTNTHTHTHTEKICI